MSRGFYVNFSVPGLDQELSKLKTYDGKSTLGVENAIAGSTKNIAKGTRQRMQVRTGRTKKSVKDKFDKRKMTGIVRVRSPVAHLLEFGAGAAIARPTKKKAMTIDEFGLRRYATEAHIPKREAHPSIGPAFESEKGNLLKNVREAIKP